MACPRTASTRRRRTSRWRWWAVPSWANCPWTSARSMTSTPTSTTTSSACGRPATGRPKSGQLVDESFKGAGPARSPMTGRRSALVDPMRVDMYNISLPPRGARAAFRCRPRPSTIGSDYFLIHVVHDAEAARRPAQPPHRELLHRRTARPTPDSWPTSCGWSKFFLSMLYLHSIYQRMAEAGESLLDDRRHLRAPRSPNSSGRAAGWTGRERRATGGLDRAYRKLGGRYAEFADIGLSRGERLLDEARRDMEDFALLIEAWGPLVRAQQGA